MSKHIAGFVVLFYLGVLTGALACQGHWTSAGATAVLGMLLSMGGAQTMADRSGTQT